MPLPPAISPATRQMMLTAFKDLEKIIAPTDSHSFADSTIQQVREAALEIERQLASRRSLRNMRRLMPLFQGLEHYSQVIEILCNGTPLLPWAWAPISLILRISSEYVEAFEQIIKAYARLAESLKRFAVLNRVFILNADFQQTLAVFYVDNLQFHGHAYKFVRRSSWKIFFTTSWGRFQRRFDNIIEDMQRHEALIGQEAIAYNISEAQIMRRDIRQWREESDRQLAVHEAELAGKQFESILTWLKADQMDQLDIFESVSEEGVRYPGTCSWVLQNAKIKSWLQRNLNLPFLWVNGSPGSGKSVIAAQLVTFMRNAGMAVAYHFCTYSYASSLTYEQILRSLLLQLVHRDSELAAHVYQKYVLEKKAPTVAILEQLLHALVASLSATPNQVEYVWILLDGIDECDSNKQARITSLVRQLASKTLSSGDVVCKVLVSSRPSLTLFNRLRKSDTVFLNEEKESLDNAIRHYTHQRLDSMHGLLGQLHVGSRFIDELVDIVAKKSDGMFLYARLVLDYISSNLFYSAQEIKDSVNQLPEKLANFYNNIMAQILRNKDPRSVDRIRCILGWVAFSKRPLKKIEFMSAVTFSSGSPTVEHLVPEYIFNSTNWLIEERNDTTLSFIHVSVKDFLQSGDSPITLREAEAIDEHGMATINCLASGLDTFGIENQEQRRLLRLVEGIHGFHIYATEYWTEYLLAHVASMAASPALLSSSKLLSLALDFASKLDRTTIVPEKRDNDSTGPQHLDKRVSFLLQYPLLKRHVTQTLQARSLERLESELRSGQLATNGSQKLVQPLPEDGISAMLATYQDSLRFLLEQHDFPGVPAVDFERFKNQFRTAALTCRLSSCPRATVGFNSDKLRDEHEMAHVRRFPCTALECQYPPFASAQALRNHTKTHHRLGPPYKPICAKKAGMEDIRTLPKMGQNSGQWRDKTSSPIDPDITARPSINLNTPSSQARNPGAREHPKYRGFQEGTTGTYGFQIMRKPSKR